MLPISKTDVSLKALQKKEDKTGQSAFNTLHTSSADRHSDKSHTSIVTIVKSKAKLIKL